MVLGAGVLTGCGGEPAAPSPSTSPAATAGAVTTAPDGVQEVTLHTQDDYVFTPSSFTVAPGLGACTTRPSPM